VGVGRSAEGKRLTGPDVQPAHARVCSCRLASAGNNVVPHASMNRS
jgi:hypothetical protein